MWPFKKKTPAPPKVRYILDPQEDLTAYELAMLLKGWPDFYLAYSNVSEETLSNKMPIGHPSRRHWIKKI